MELEFDKYCVVDGSPTTVLPVEKKRPKRKPKCGNLNKDFNEIDFHRYRSVSCKDSVSRASRSEVVRRGSAYCSSKELRCFQKTDAGEERRKIEFSSGYISASSFGIVDALCSSDEDNSQAQENASSVTLMDSDLSTGACKNNLNADLFKSPIHPIPEIGSSENRYEGNRPRETAVFPKSLSAKFRVPLSPARSESDCSRASTSSKSMFIPMKKIFDPFRKSKSQRSPLSNPIDSECRLTSLDGNKFSNMTQQFDCANSLPSWKESHNNSRVPSLPATHLHGFLQLDRKHGVPFFEFSVNFPEDVFLAKTWKVGNTLNRVYKFYSLRNTRKSHGSGCGSNDCTKESVLVGQMQVSSTKVKNANNNNNCMVMEFVLYDTAHPRKSVSFWDSSSPSYDVSKGSTGGNNESDEFLMGKTKRNNQSKNGVGSSKSSGTHPMVEIAAIVIEVPVEKRENLRFKSGFKNEQTLSNLLGFPFFQGTRGNVSNSKVAMVIPSGNHSLPTTETESHGPSPLLDRWRCGGGCDCGGWDMACPLNVFCNLNNIPGCPLLDNQTPLQLFIQGKKDKTPALTVRMVEDGQYGVDFHAQLSALQAFAISVAILHAMEEASTCMEGKSLVQELLVEDEVTSSTKTVREEEKQPSFVVNPPFSPIARV